MINPEKNPFKRSNKRPLILDGATGSLLQQNGYKPDTNIWMTLLNQTSPKVIVEMHKSYIDAGADIITTNTFRTNPAAVEAFGLSNSAPLVKDAVILANKAVGDRKILIAGSNAPAEDCYQKERNLSYKKLEINHNNHIDLLIDNDVDLILNETQSHFDEINIICKHCSKNGIPFIVSIYFTGDSRILSGESITEIISFIMEHEPLAIGFNCVAPDLFLTLLSVIETNFNWGYYLNCGGVNPADKKIECAVSANDYLEKVKTIQKYKPSFIGACCGSNPSHIKSIIKYFDEENS